ncbi:cation:proton antiporter domain-containing protein [Oscillatoria salina]|uniref:cation:proton antiporter domain-containing protein n=1 Tax=Oscillatoria salina TaxID=331517 RepID=UPI001CCF95DD|nr:cation:proton antiporter [Oscillatoria salina]MBZ8181518.1 universal stress protein [Oscillatoria salina IIICB1]
MEQILKWLPDSPIVGFTILLLVILILPPIFERLRLPGLVGLLVAGVCLGPDGLGLLSAESETMKLLSDIGKIYLMFVAGLEIDLAEFRKTKNRSLTFGFATFIIPLIGGASVGLALGMGWNASILIGSLLASHTLLGYPIVNRLGVTNNEAVTVSIGATIFTDISALLILAICVSIHAGDFSAVSLVSQLGALAIYSVIVLFGFGWAGKEYFRRTGDEESNQFLFVLLAVFLASVGAQIINVDKIVGAFLAGLAVNDVVGGSPVEEKIEFVGSTLFIPFFFVDMGLLLNVSGFVNTLTTELLLTGAIVGVLISCKFLAAFITKQCFGYNWNETMTMWSLSLPQVAATLAAALVGLNAGLIPDSVFNTVIVLMLVTAILGPVLTARFARKLPLPKTKLDSKTAMWGVTNDVESSISSRDIEFNLEKQNSTLAIADSTDLAVVPRTVPTHTNQPTSSNPPFTVLVPVSNPHTERYLVEMGARLARHESGMVVPLSIAKAHVHMDEPELELEIAKSQRLLERATAVAEEFQVKAKTIVRVDDDVSYGISRAGKEQDASLIVMGWSPTTSLQARLFGNVINSVFWSAHCPVAVMRLLEEPINIRQILVPVKNITPQTLRTIRFAQLFADTNKAQITCLHVGSRAMTAEQIYIFESELAEILSQSHPQVDLIIKTIRSDEPAEAILKAARSFDLVILRSLRRRTVAGLAVSDVTTRVISQLSSSLILFGEPNSPHWIGVDNYLA